MDNKNFQKRDQDQLPKSPFPYWLSIGLVNPIRKIFVNRNKIVKEAGIREGSIVLEVGCGPGFFTETISKVVGRKGRVYAQDVQEEMIEKLKKRIEKLETKDNIQSFLSNSSKIDLPSESVDVIFAANVFEEIEVEGGTEETAEELYSLCKKGGLLMFIEHKFGVPKSVIQRIYGIIESKGFILLNKRETFFSYYAKFEKPLNKR